MSASRFQTSHARQNPRHLANLFVSGFSSSFSSFAQGRDKARSLFRTGELADPGRAKHGRACYSCIDLSRYVGIRGRLEKYSSSGREATCKQVQRTSASTILLLECWERLNDCSTLQCTVQVFVSHRCLSVAYTIVPFEYLYLWKISGTTGGPRVQLIGYTHTEYCSACRSS